MNEARRHALSPPDRARTRTPSGFEGEGPSVEREAVPPQATLPAAWRLRRAAAMGLAGGLTGLAIGAAIYQFGPEVDAGASSVPRGQAPGPAEASAAMPAAAPPDPGAAGAVPSADAAVEAQHRCREPVPPASAGAPPR